MKNLIKYLVLFIASTSFAQNAGDTRVIDSGQPQIYNGYNWVIDWNSIGSGGGSQGQDGVDGLNGVDGQDGQDGVDGESAFETWLSLGNTGLEQDFLDSLQGEKGDTGLQGIQGVQGLQGESGTSTDINTQYVSDLGFDTSTEVDSKIEGISLDVTDEVKQEIIDSVSESVGIINTPLEVENQAKKAIQNLSGYQTNNYINYEDLQDGHIAGSSSEVVTPSTTGQKVTNPVYIDAGEYSYYGVGEDYGFTFTHYTQMFDLNGVYLGTFSTFGNNNIFTMPQDGYIIAEVINDSVTGDQSKIYLGRYNSLFDEDVNEDIYFDTSINNGYNPQLVGLPELEFIETDNVLNVDNIQSPIVPITDTAFVIRLEVPKDELGNNVDEYISIRDGFPIKDGSRKFLIEYDVNGTEIGSLVLTTLGSEFTRYKINPLAVNIDINFFRVTNNATWGGSKLTPQRLNDNLRVNFGSYYTNEVSGKKLFSANGFPVQGVENKLKGKNVVAVGDSITKGNEIGGVSYLDPLFNNHEMSVFNFSSGSAGITDWDDTEVITSIDNYPFENSSDHDNVVSNQLNLIVEEGVIPDIGIITGGTNDSFRNRVIGDIEIAKTLYDTPDSLNREEIVGSLVYSIAKMRGINPECKIILIAPVSPSNFNNGAIIQDSIIPIQDAIIEVAKQFGCEYLDWRYLLNRFPSQVNTDYNDSLHPTVYATIEKMGAELVSKVESMID